MNESEKKVEVTETQILDNKKTLSDDKNLNKKIKIIALIIIVLALLWIFIINPFITFKSNEKSFASAGKKYFDNYPNELPTGKRVADITLQELNEKGFIEKDYYIPYRLFTKKTCSVTDSWVKVVQVDGEYKYYTYLKCGLYQSNVDHEGPKITINGKEEITISLGDQYKDAGVKSVNDSTDGDMDISVVKTKNEVDTTKVGTYKVTYTAIDSLKNKTTVVRKVNVVQKLNSTVKKTTGNTGYYTGSPDSNYISFSGMLFRIVDLDGDNVRIIADKDVANVNHDSIDEWLDYYYEHITDESRKLIVKNKYCNMTLTANDTDTTECSNYTKARNVYIASVIDVNKAEQNGSNFLRPATMSWLADSDDDKSSYATRYAFSGEHYEKRFMTYDASTNNGIRPLLTIKGDTLIKGGTGKYNDPFTLDDFAIGKTDDKLNTRHSGEYIMYNDYLWRIIDPQSDGTTKVISTEPLYNNDGTLQIDNYSEKYNPTKKGNIGYEINNKSTEYLDTKYFVKHEIEVPIYKSVSKYGKETKVEKYKTTISAPNMYEMFTAYENDNSYGYWLINTSNSSTYVYAISGTGVVTDGTDYVAKTGVRAVGFLNKNCVIVSGKGTEKDPYVISK